MYVPSRPCYCRMGILLQVSKWDQKKKKKNAHKQLGWKTASRRETLCDTTPGPGEQTCEITTSENFWLLHSNWKLELQKEKEGLRQRGRGSLALWHDSTEAWLWRMWAPARHSRALCQNGGCFADGGLLLLLVTSVSQSLWTNVTCIFSQRTGSRKMRDLSIFNDHLFNPKKALWIPTKNTAHLRHSTVQTRASREFLLVLGPFHHSGHGAQVKVRNSAYQLHANHLFATAAHSRPSIIVAPSWKKQLLAARMTGRWWLRLCKTHLNTSTSLCVCACVCMCVYVFRKVREFGGCACIAWI